MKLAGQKLEFVMDGDQWCCRPVPFTNLQEMPCGFGKTKHDALINYVDEAEIDMEDVTDETDYIDTVIELLDCVIIQDLMDMEGYIDETPEHTVPCYALGFPSELAAGLRGSTITPYFDSQEKLQLFCALYMGKFYQMEESNTVWFINDAGEDVGKPEN